MALPPEYGGGLERSSHTGSSSAPAFFHPSQFEPSAQRPPFHGVETAEEYPNPFFAPQGKQFDIFEWYPHFQSCVRYFIDHAQYQTAVQAEAALVNIQLPFQRPQNNITGTKPGSPSSIAPSASRSSGKLPMPALPGHMNGVVTVTPYIRRLVATGQDHPAVLHGFFGDDWVAGIGFLHEVERRNYLLAAKSASWLEVKAHYDMPDGQLIPFLLTLRNVSEKEIVSAERNWSEWLAMQDWMVGPRSPDANPSIDPTGSFAE